MTIKETKNFKTVEVVREREREREREPKFKPIWAW